MLPGETVKAFEDRMCTGFVVRLTVDGVDLPLGADLVTLDSGTQLSQTAYTIANCSPTVAFAIREAVKKHRVELYQAYLAEAKRLGLIRPPEDEAKPEKATGGKASSSSRARGVSARTPSPVGV